MGFLDTSTSTLVRTPVCTEHNSFDVAALLIMCACIFAPASIPPNKTVRFQAALEDAQKNEYPNTHLFVEIRKSVTHAIPEQAVDPDSRVGVCLSCPPRIGTQLTVDPTVQLQTIANRMVLAKMELHDLRTAVEKRRKREQEQVRWYLAWFAGYVRDMRCVHHSNGSVCCRE